MNFNNTNKQNALNTILIIERSGGHAHARVDEELGDGERREWRAEEREQGDRDRVDQAPGARARAARAVDAVQRAGARPRVAQRQARGREDPAVRAAASPAPAKPGDTHANAQQQGHLPRGDQSLLVSRLSSAPAHTID